MPTIRSIGEVFARSWVAAQITRAFGTAQAPAPPARRRSPEARFHAAPPTASRPQVHLRNRHRPAARRPAFGLEAVEPRLLLSADLTYGNLGSLPSNILDAAAIETYVDNLVSTDFTLKVVAHDSKLWWRLENSTLGDYEIDDAGDLDVNLKRDDFGVNNSSLSLIDFVGDKVRVDIDSMSLLDGHFNGTTIDIDFAGGKDIDLGALLGVQMPGPLSTLANDQVVLNGDGAVLAQHGLKIHSSSDIVNEQDADGVTATVSLVAGKIEIVSDSQITIDQGSTLTGPSVSLLADAKSTSGLFQGLLANASSTIVLDDTAHLVATAAAGTVQLFAHSDVTFTEDGDTYFGDGLSATAALSISGALVDIKGHAQVDAPTLNIEATIHTDITATAQASTVRVVTVNVFNTPEVRISGNADLTTSGNLSALAKSDVHITNTTVPKAAGSSTSTDAAVSSTIVEGDAKVDITGGTIAAGGTATFKADDKIVITSTADGAQGGSDGSGGGGAGATLAFSLMMGNTKASVSGGTISADAITVEATSDRMATSLSKASKGGAQASGESGNNRNESEKRLADPNKDGDESDKADTGEGNIPFAAAVAVGVAIDNTESSITGGSVHATAGNLAVKATGKLQLITTADGSTKEDDGSAAVGVAVALGIATPDVIATIGGSADLDGNAVQVAALVQPSKVESTATAGASGGDIGFAGALAINVALIDVDARVSGNVNVNGADVTVSAKSTTDSKTVAKAQVNGSGDATGIGASIAINVVDNDTIAELANGGTLTGAHDLTLDATSDHGIVTQAKGGAAGGTSVTPVVAVTIGSVDTEARLGTDDQTLSISGALSATARHDGAVDTLADGEAAGSNAAVGAAVGFAYISDVVVATTLRNLAVSGAATFVANSVSTNSTRAKASASGASDDGQDAQSKSDSKKNAGNSRASTAGASQANTSGKSTATTSDDSGGSGSISVAAAIAINIVDSEARAEIGVGVSVSAGGTLTVRSGTNVDGSGEADGRAAEGGSAAVGAAVSVNSVDVENTARVAGTVTAADGLVVEALMLDRKIDSGTTTVQIVDAGAETIFLGTGHGLTTGQKVKYHNGGGTDIGGLTNDTEYYVNDAGGGKIKLYTSEASAKAGGATDLVLLDGTGGTGHDHSFGKFIDVPIVGEIENPLDSGKIHFNPDPNSLRVLDVGSEDGLRTGDAVVYHKGAGAPIGGLADGTTYYVIVLDEAHSQLATSRDNAFKGTSIPLTSDDVSDDDFLTEATHSILASAISGAGSDDVGVAGSAAINRAAVVTLAEVKGNVALADGADGGAGIGALAVRAFSTTDNTALALPAGAGAVADSVGVGASFALNMNFNDTTAQITDGAIVSGGPAGSFTMEADADHRMSTEARNGAKGSGTSIGGAVAVVISEADTKAYLGTGGTIDSTGAASVTSHHGNIVETKLSSEAAGDDAAIGASVGVNYIADTNNAQIARNVHATGGSVTLTADLAMVLSLDAHASAAGGDSGGDDADTQADKKTNNNSNTGGGKSLESAGDNTSSANSESSSQTGSQGESGGGGGVGVAAAVSISVARLTNTATVTNGADLTAGGAVSISAQASVDAKAQADGMSVNLSNSSGTSVSAAVALNFVNLTETATVGSGSVITGNGITLQAVTTDSNQNDFVATAFAVSGNKSNDPSIAGVFALNVIDSEVKAQALDGADLESTGNVTVAAENVMGLQALAASVAFSTGGTVVGGAIVVNIVGTGTGGSNTIASIGTPGGSGATANADGAVSVAATHHLNMTGSVDLPETINAKGVDDPSFSIGSVAVAAAGSSGGTASIAGSVAINWFDTTTQASVSGASSVNGKNNTEAGSLSITATDTLDWTSVAGSVGVALDGVGIGAGLDLALIDTDTRAYIGKGADVDVSGDVSITALSTQGILSIAANAGIGLGSVGIGATAAVQVITTHTRAYVEDDTVGNSTHVDANGNVIIQSTGTLDLKLIAAAIGAGNSVGIGAGNATLVHTDVVEAYVGNYVEVSSGGANGVRLAAHSSEDLIGITAAGSGGGSVAVSGAATITILDETTTARVGRGADITATSGGDLWVKADDSTTLITVAGSLALSGSVGVGVGADVTKMDKTTKAYIDSGVVATINGDVDVTAVSSEDVTSVAAGISASGSAAVTADVSVHVITNTTRAFIGDEDGVGSLGAGDVHAHGSVRVWADDSTELDKVIGAAAFSGGAAITAAGGVTVSNKTTEGFIAKGAKVTGDGFGSLAAPTGGFDLNAETVDAEEQFQNATATGVDGNFGNNGIQDTITRTDGGSFVDDGFVVGQVIHLSGDGPNNGDYTIAAGGVTANQLKLTSNHVLVAGAFTGWSVTAYDPDAAGIEANTSANASKNDLKDSGEIRPPTPVGGGDGGDNVKDQDGHDVAVSDEDLTTNIHLSAATASASGVIVAATNHDDIETYSIGLSGAAGVAVGIAASVNVINATTNAYIADDALINSEQGAANAAQGVAVVASNDLHHTAAAAAVSVGTVAVSPAVDVTVSDNKTHATIGDASVYAKDDVHVIAHASEDITLVGVGLAGGVVGVGAGVNVLSLNGETIASVDGLVRAGGDLVVRANDDTDVTVVSGGLGVGFVGVGAGIGVLVIAKDTQANIADGADVTALGGGVNGESVLTGDISGGALAAPVTVHGVVVDASSKEDIFNLAIAAAGGFVGVSASVGVSVIEARTHAAIGDADVNKNDNGSASGNQDVYVNASDDVSALTMVLAAAGGFVGAAGSVNVGVINNDTSAQILAGAEVHAAGDVEVNAVGLKSVDSIVISAAGGFVGLAGAVSVWSIGDSLDSTYTNDESRSSDDRIDNGASGNPSDKSANALDKQFDDDEDGTADRTESADKTAQDDADDSRDMGRDTMANTSSGQAGPTGSRMNLATGGATSAINGSKLSQSASGRLTTVPLSGTSALIQGGTTSVTAGGHIDVQANEAVDVFSLTGSAGFGVVGGGIGVSILSVHSNVTASAGGTLSAGDTLTVRSDLDEHLPIDAFALGGGLVGIAGVVSVVNDDSTSSASIGASSTIVAADAVSVTARSKQNLELNALGGALGAAAQGVAFTSGTVSGSTSASIGNDVQIGQTDAVGALNVTADSEVIADVHTIGLAGGIIAGTINFGYMTVTPTVQATVGSADIKITGDALISATFKANVDARVDGDAVGLFAGGASFTTADLRPDITSSLGTSSAGTFAGGNLTVEAKEVRPAGYGANAKAFAAGIGGVGISGAVSEAIDSPDIDASVGTGMDINNSGSVRVTADSNANAVATSGGIAGGVAGIGITISEANAKGSTKAHMDGEIKNASGGAGATTLNVEATGNDTANATSKAVTGGLFADGINLSDATVDTTTQAYIDSNGLVSTGSNITVAAVEHPEADSLTKGVAVGGIVIGGSQSTTKVDPDVTAYISASTVRTAGAGNVSVTATNAPNSVEPPDYGIDSVDSTNDTLHVEDHGLSTGDVVAYDDNGQADIGGLTGAISTGLNPPNDKLYREYNVISLSQDELSFGSIIDGSADIDAATDTISFGLPHNFRTGDRVFYKPGVDDQGHTAPTVSGLTANTLYYVLVLDGQHIKLTSYDPLTTNPMRFFTPDDTSDTITVTGHGFNTGDAVTYHAPTAKTFVSKQVDVDDDTEDDDGVDVATLPDVEGNNNIIFTNENGSIGSFGFAAGDFVSYSASDPSLPIGGLHSGTVYRVGGTTDSGITLHAYRSLTATFHDNGDASAHDTITRSGGSWLDDGFRSGQTINVSGTGSNDGNYQISSVSAGTITLVAGNLLDNETHAAAIESDTISLDPAKAAPVPPNTPPAAPTPAMRVTHSLIDVRNLPMTASGVGSMDDKTFYVIKTGNDTFQLADTKAHALALNALDLDGPASAFANHPIGPEAIDLGTAAGPQILRVDITSNGAVGGGQRLVGPGGIALNVLSPPSGDGTSSAKSAASGGGVVSVSVNDTTIDNDPTVDAHVDTGLLSAGGSVTISAASTTSSTASTTNAGGGLVGVGVSDSDSNQDVASQASVADGSRIVAGNDFTLSAFVQNNSDNSTRAITGGAVGVAVSNADSDIAFETKVTIGAGADVLAGDNVVVKAESRSHQSSTAVATGIGIGGDGNADSEVQVTHGDTVTEIGAAAAVSGRTVSMSAKVTELYVRAKAEGYGGGLVAVGTADATVFVDTDNEVNLRAQGAVTGYEGVDFITRFQGVTTDADSFSRATGLFGYVSSDSVNHTTLDSGVLGEAGAVVTAGPRNPTADPDLSDVGGFLHLAFYVSTENDAGSISIVTHDDTSLRSLAVDGSDSPVNVATLTPNIAFSSNVVILSGKSPELVVSASGNIDKAVNISVTDGADTNKTSGVIAGGTIFVNDVINDDPGEVYFNSAAITGGGGTPATDGTWEFRDSFQQVKITNLSNKILQINNIDVLNTTVQPVVDLDTPTNTLTFNIVRTVKPSLVDVENLGTAMVLLNGTIENPIGTTIIRNAQGNVRASKPRGDSSGDGRLSRVRTNILDIETPGADASIGQGSGGNRVSIDVIDAAGLPTATNFLTARAASDGSIYLGQHLFFTGELVRYDSSDPIGGLQDGKYYVVIASSDGLSIKLAEVATPDTAILLNPGASTPTQVNALTPAQRFTVEAGKDAFLDIQGHQRVNSPSYTVTIDAVNTGGTADLLLQTSIKQTTVANSGGVEVQHPGSPNPNGVTHFTFFDSPDGAAPALNAGAFGTGSTNVDTTYDFRAMDRDGNKWLAGITAGSDAEPDGGNIVITAAEPVAASPKIINVRAITEIVGSGYAESAADDHHVDVLTNGFITLAEKTHDLRVGRIASTAGDVTLLSPRRIVDARNDGIGIEADVTGRNLTLTAGDNEITGTAIDKSGQGGIGTGANFLETNVDLRDGAGANLGVLKAFDIQSGLNTQGIFITEVLRGAELTTLFGAGEPGGKGDLMVHTVHTKGDASLATQNGSIFDARNNGAGDAAADVIANSIDLFANLGSIGAIAPDGQAHPAPSNDLEIDSQVYATGEVAMRAATGIFVTETESGPAPGVTLPAHPARPTTTGYGLHLVLAQTTQAGGDIRLTVRESADLDEDLVLDYQGDARFLENVLENLGDPTDFEVDSAGWAELRIGDDLVDEQGPNLPTSTIGNSVVQAAEWIDIFLDDVNLDPNFGAHSTLSGTYRPGTLVGSSPAHPNITRIFGHTDVDTLLFDKTDLDGKTEVYGSQNTSALDGADGEDRYTIDRLLTMNVAAGHTLTLDGQAGTDYYTVYTTGSQAAVAERRNYVINILDTGAETDGVDEAFIYGVESANNGYTADPNDDPLAKYPADDIFLLRQSQYIPSLQPGDTASSGEYGMAGVNMEQADHPAFVALLHGDLSSFRQTTPPSGQVTLVQRINYDAALNGRLNVYGLSGNDYFASDDNSVITQLDGGVGGGDTFQIGQIFGSQRDDDPGTINPLDAAAPQFGGALQPYDVFPKLIATTRGWLSPGISAPLVANGGTGNDEFYVYANQAELRLEGDDDNDLFVVRAFALAAVVDTDANGDGLLDANDIDDPYGVDSNHNGIADAGDVSLDPLHPLLLTGPRIRHDINGDGIFNAADAHTTTDTNGDNKINLLDGPNHWQDDKIILDLVEGKYVARPVIGLGFSTGHPLDIRAGGGDDEVQYNVNAPVSLDGGTGFDKLVVLATEFADDIAITDKGVFGAGLNVRYTHP